jgi:hypothetical protein
MKPLTHIKKTSILRNLFLCLGAIFALVTAGFALAQQAPASVSIRVIATFDYPGTGNSTLPSHINDRGDVVGLYVTPRGATRGFVRFANGNFGPPIIEPNDSCYHTEARGINNSGLVCGAYYNGADCTAHGLFLMRHNFTDFDVPGALDTTLSGLNNVGDFAGWFTDNSGITEAFVSIGGTITAFSLPGASVSRAYQLNTSNQSAGFYDDSAGLEHGYWRDTDGTLYFPIDPPGSTDTVLFGNNDSNWIVGRYDDRAGVTHGLFFVPPNKFFSFDYPGSSFTSFNGINGQGFICGRYDDDSGIEHGIIAQVRVMAGTTEMGGPPR